LAAEYRDSEFLEKIGLGRATEKFWPSGGPQWDALAVSNPRLRPAGLRRQCQLPPAADIGLECAPDGGHFQAAGNELLRDLPLERDAVGALSGHGFHPLKAQLTLSNH
jgi:hypothetical protein